MKTKKFLSIIAFAITTLLFTSCGPNIEEVTLEKFNIKISIPKTNEKLEWKNLKIADYDTDLSRYDFYIGKRVNIIEIVKRVFPDNLTMLKEAVSADEKFVKTIDTKEFENGAFGVIFSKKTSSGKEIKDYLFYYQKDGRYFKMKPVFNSKLEQLDIQLSAYQSMK